MGNWFDANRIVDGPCEKCWNRHYHYHTCPDYDASLENDLVTFKEEPVESTVFKGEQPTQATSDIHAVEIESPLEQVIRRWEANRDFPEGMGTTLMYDNKDLFRDLLIMVDELQGAIHK